MSEIGFPYDSPTTLFMDSQSAICLAYNNRYQVSLNKK